MVTTELFLFQGLVRRKLISDLSCILIMKNYSLIKHLQAGSFGSAHLAESKETGEKVVVKEGLPAVQYQICR